MKKKRPIKNTWYEWLINFITEPLRKTVDGFKNKVVSVLKTNTSGDYGKQSVYGSGKKLSKLKLKKESEEDGIIKNIRNLFKLKKENNAIKDRIFRDIKTLFKQEEDYYKPVRGGNFWNNNYIEYESNSDRSKNLSVEEYLNEIKPYFKDIAIDLQKSDTWKIQLTIAINFISSKATDKEQVCDAFKD